MEIKYAHSLKPYNTMGIDAGCPEFFPVNKEEELEILMDRIQYPHYVLGGGSNVLLPDNFLKSVLHNRILGIEILEETSDTVSIELGGGVVWHEFVRWAVKRDYYGVENLSLIPGTVGAAPIQNIGAYGVEVKDVLTSVKYCDLQTGKWTWIDKAECGFAYRDSIFKNELKGKIFISKVRLKLSKIPQYNLSYGALSALEESAGNLNAMKISDTVIAIRQSKLPDPEVLSNSGSFFKNPVVDATFAKAIKAKYVDMPSYPLDENHVKIPAAWLIEQAGFKGKRYGQVGCYEKHALVIVNYGNASSEEIRAHIDRIQKGVYSLFKIKLQAEVNVL